MTLTKTLLAAALATLALGAQAAAPTISFTGNTTSDMAGAITIDFDSGVLPANYAGGALWNTSTNEYAQPPGATGYFLSVGNSPAAQTGTATATFTGGLSYFGFYWGSPDTYNMVTVHTADGGLYDFSGTSLVAAASASAPTWGDRNVGIYVNMVASGSNITQIDFYSPSQNALETDNHAFIAAVPEPETYAMMAAGLGLLAFMRRRKA